MKAFFDIDTQMDFIFPAGALYAPGAVGILPHVARLNRLAHERGLPLISTMCAHGDDAAEFQVWRPHCVKGTLGQRKPASTLVPSQILLEKDDLDLFSNPSLEKMLDTLRIEECVVYGLLTEYCVKHAAMGLLARGRKVSLVLDAIHHLSAEDAVEVVKGFVAAGGVCVFTDDVRG